MTQTGSPYDNAIAKRVNGILNIVNNNSNKNQSVNNNQ
ncbi:hypothetical protein QFZ20_003241 [Flavobacterium sp. W4I14]|nr:hypothetical protein [Flavobacterium sp. W4I14]